MATQKLERLIDAIKDELSLRFPSWTVEKLYNATPDAYLKVTVSGGNISYILGVPETAPASGLADGLGLTQRVYTPDVIRFGYDTTTAFGAAGFAMLAVCLAPGARVEFYTDAAIAVADLSGPTSAKYIASFQNLQWGYLANI